MFDINPETVAILIPIIAVLGGITIAVIGIVMGAKEEELKHKERIIAMEKGMPIPEMPKKERRPAYLTLRAWGLIITCVGLAIMISITVAEGFHEGIWGLIPTGVGIGFLVAAMLERKDTAK